MIALSEVKKKGHLTLEAVLLLLAVFASGFAGAKELDLDVAMGTPYLLADKKQTAFLKVALTGFELDRAEARTPVNIALVLDRSGSMTGQKIEKAKEAAIMAVGRLNSNDIVSLVAYDDTVHVLLPATKLTNKQTVYDAINRLSPGSSTALFAGVSKGAQEVRKFLHSERVNRVILLSDGLANVGPSSPSALGDLGLSLVKEGISVTTLGLGLDYNEDLMAQLAGASDGNHAFIESAVDLARIFDLEFQTVLSVVAQKIQVRIKCDEGIRPVRVLGREAEIDGQTVVSRLNQLCSNQEMYILLEVEIPASAVGESRRIAEVAVTYDNMDTQRMSRRTSIVGVTFTDSSRLVERETNTEVMISSVQMISNETNKLALDLRDAGKVKEAEEVLLRNVAYLGTNADQYRSEQLRSLQRINQSDASNLSPEQWQSQRKAMRKKQHEIDSWQIY